MAYKNPIIEVLSLPKHGLAAVLEIISSLRLLLSIAPQYLVGFGSGYLVYHFIIITLTPVLSSYLAFELKDWPQFIASSINWITGGVAKLISITVAGIGSVLGGYLAILLLAGFFVELFIEQVFKKRGLKPIHAPSLFGAILRLIKDETAKIILIALLGITALVTAFIPVLTPISIILGALIIGFELFDQPLTLLGLKFKDRLKMESKHLLVILALGAAFSLSAVIPFLPILLLPVGSLTAIRIFESWQEVYHLKTSSTPEVQR